MRILTYVKPSQVRDVIKGYFLDLELKAAFGIKATKWAVRGPLSVLDSQLTFVTHLL